MNKKKTASTVSEEKLLRALTTRLRVKNALTRCKNNGRNF